MKNILFLIFLGFFSFSSFSQEIINDVVPVRTYKNLIIGKQVQLVDVRTPNEYNSGKIEGAINIDYLDKENFKAAFEKLNKDQALYIYCRSGSRSHESAIILEEMGFKEIHDLKGGYHAWVKTE